MNIEYIQISRPFCFSSPFNGKEFTALLYIIDEHITPDEQEKLSDEIVASGCRNAVCAGYECGSWDDSIDMADLKRNDWEVNEDTDVMTSWHENKSIEDIVYFFLNNSHFRNFIPENFLVAGIGNDSGVMTDIRKEIEAQASSVQYIA